VLSIWRQPYARVHFGSSGQQLVSARWPPTCRLSCKLDLWVCLKAAIDWTFAHCHWYYYSTIRFDTHLPSPRRVAGWVYLGHCSQCAARAQSCISWLFREKHKLLPTAWFKPGPLAQQASVLPLDHCDLCYTQLWINNIYICYENIIIHTYVYHVWETLDTTICIDNEVYSEGAHPLYGALCRPGSDPTNL